MKELLLWNKLIILNWIWSFKLWTIKKKLKSLETAAQLKEANDTANNL